MADWYAIHDADGNLRSVGTVLADDATLAAKGLTKRLLPGQLNGKIWNPATRDFDITPPSAVPVWTRFEFLSRFTAEERIAMRNLRKTNGALDDFMAMVETAGELRADHPMITQGLAYLVARGWLTKVRADEIGAY